MSVITQPATCVSGLVPDLVVVSCDDNLVFAHETLGRLWRLTGWPWAANENLRAGRRPQPSRPVLI